MAALIEVRLTELAQLFNSMDPSPFHERDLDHDAEEFIVSWAQEHARWEDLKLVVHLTRPPADGPPDPQLIENSVQHYFSYRAELLWREFSQLMKEGRLSLLVGLGFLVLCQAGIWLLHLPAAGIGHAVHEWSLPGLATQFQGFLREGLTIVGWVAMWRPLEIYLYRWWPLLGRRRLYQRLASMTVEVRLPA